MRRRIPEGHPNGYYYARVKGRRINLGKNLQKARIKLHELESDLAKGTVVVGGTGTTQMTVGGKKDIHIKELAVKHLEWVQANRAKNTFVGRQYFVCQFLDYVGDKMVSEITFADLDSFYTYCRKHHSRGVNGGNHALRAAKSLLKWGEEHEICDCPVKRFPVASEKPPKTKKFTKEEVSKLLEISSPDFADLIRFSIATGLRPFELRGLKKSHIQIQGTVKTIRIEEHKTSESAKTYMTRSVPLSPEALEIFERQSQKHPKSEFVFLNGNGKPYTGDVLRRRLEKTSRRAGLETKTPYCCRHAFGTALGANGVNLAVIAQLMGHSNIQTTTRYIANNDEAHIKAVAVMDKIIPSAPQKTANNKASSAADYCI